MITPERGKVYIIKHTSGMIKARFLYSVERGGGSWGRSMTHYIFQNLSTGRDIEIKSRVKIRKEILLEA